MGANLAPSFVITWAGSWQASAQAHWVLAKPAWEGKSKQEGENGGGAPKGLEV